MYDAQWDLKELGAITKRLQGVAIETRGKTGRVALNAAARVVVKAARANAMRVNNPATRNIIAKNIVARFNSRYFKGTGDLMFRVGVLGGARNYEAYGEFKTGKSASENPGGDTFYWRFVEFGTENHAAKPFMRPALEENIGPATDAFIQAYFAAIDKAIGPGFAP